MNYASDMVITLRHFLRSSSNNHSIHWRHDNYVIGLNKKDRARPGNGTAQYAPFWRENRLGRLLIAGEFGLLLVTGSGSQRHWRLHLRPLTKCLHKHEQRIPARRCGQTGVNAQRNYAERSTSRNRRKQYRNRY